MEKIPVLLVQSNSAVITQKEKTTVHLTKSKLVPTKQTLQAVNVQTVNLSQ